MRVKLFGFLALVLCSPLAMTMESPPVNEGTDPDPAEWGIRNGCIPNMHIKRIHFISSTTGMAELSSGRKIKVTLRNRCSGIRTEGYVHKPINNRFCEGDMLRVINYGHACVVDTLEPYIALEKNSEEQPGAAVGNTTRH